VLVLALNSRVGPGLQRPPHFTEAAALEAAMLLDDAAGQSQVAVLGLTARGMQNPIVPMWIRTPASASPQGCSCA